MYPNRETRKLVKILTKKSSFCWPKFSAFYQKRVSLFGYIPGVFMYYKVVVLKVRLFHWYLASDSLVRNISDLRHIFFLVFSKDLSVSLSYKYNQICRILVQGPAHIRPGQKYQWLVQNFLARPLMQKMFPGPSLYATPVLNKKKVVAPAYFCWGFVKKYRNRGILGNLQRFLWYLGIVRSFIARQNVFSNSNMQLFELNSHFRKLILLRPTRVGCVGVTMKFHTKHGHGS